MLSAHHVPAVSDPATQFIDSQAQNVISDTVSINLPSRDPSWFVRAITIESVQSLSWEVWFFESATNLQGGLTDSAFLYGIALVTPLAAIIDPSISPEDDLLRYVTSNLLIPYVDRDAESSEGPAKLHMRLVNRAAGAKNAGASGAVKVTVWCSQQGGQS